MEEEQPISCNVKEKGKEKDDGTNMNTTMKKKRSVSQMTNSRPKILLGVTGSVAAIKGPEIASRLVQELNADVRVLLTAGGLNFWSKAESYNEKYWNVMRQSLATRDEVGNDVDEHVVVVDDDGNDNTEVVTATKTKPISIYYPEDEWKAWKTLGDPVLHIELRDWADMLLIAPLSAHTLAKLANGLCDDTLSCVFRAWDFGHGIRPGKPILLAPAMNTAMWDHPLTQQQLNGIGKFWNVSRSSRNEISILEPQPKVLACGETGNGALASVDDILESVNDILTTKKNCSKMKISP